ncbi:hypothetical protein [Microbacterium sp. CJ88]
MTMLRTGLRLRFGFDAAGRVGAAGFATAVGAGRGARAMRGDRERAATS